MSCKPWSKDLTYSELIKPVRASLNLAYKLTRTKLKTIPYDGFNFGTKTLAHSLAPDENLKAQALARHAEQGRDVMDVLFLIAFQLGVEQGQQMKEEELEVYKTLAENLLKKENNG